MKKQRTKKAFRIILHLGNTKTEHWEYSVSPARALDKLKARLDYFDCDCIEITKPAGLSDKEVFDF